MSKFVSDFPGKKPNEQVIYLLRRHWAIFAKQTFILVGLFILPIVGYFVTINYADFLFDSPYLEFIVLILSIYYLIFWNYLLIAFTNHYFDVWIVTNERLIDIEQISLFERVVSEAKLDKIQDVTAETKGVFATLFKYGQIHVQTAGTTQRFTFQDVPHPTRIKKVILDIQDKYLKKLQREEATKMAQATPGIPGSPPAPLTTGTQSPPPQKPKPGDEPKPKPEPTTTQSQGPTSGLSEEDIIEERERKLREEIRRKQEELKKLEEQDK